MPYVGEGVCFLDCSGYSQQPELTLQLLVALGSHDSLILHASIFIFGFLKMLKQMLVHLAIAPNSHYRGHGPRGGMCPLPTLFRLSMLGSHLPLRARRLGGLGSDTIDTGSQTPGTHMIWHRAVPLWGCNCWDSQHLQSTSMSLFLHSPHARHRSQQTTDTP